MTALMEIDGLTVAIAQHPVCTDLTLTLRAGEVWGLLGANGAGKTTLLLTLAGLRRPRSGTIRLNGHPIASLPRRTLARALAFLPQDDSETFPQPVLERVLSGAYARHGPCAPIEAAERDRARHALDRVSLGALAQRMSDTLSGGERRRLALATRLMQQASVLLLDEPLGHLDPGQRIAVLDLLRAEASARQATVLASLHDVDLAVRGCDRLLVLLPGGEAVAVAAGDLDAETVGRLYGHPVQRVRTTGRTLYLME